MPNKLLSNNKNSNFVDSVPMLWVIIPYIIGIVLADRVGIIASLNLWFIGGIIYIALIVLLGKIRNQTTGLNLVFNISILAFIAYLSFTYTSSIQYSNLKFTHDYTYNDSSGYSIIRLSDDGLEKKSTIRYTTTIIDTKFLKDSTIPHVNAYIYLQKSNLRYAKGDTLIVPSRWEKIKNSKNPFSFDYATFCFRKGIFLNQYIDSGKAVLIGVNRHRTFIDKVKGFGLKKLDYYIKDSKNKGLLKAMILGDEADLDPEMQNVYADTGIIHIVSISGAHVAILFGALLFLFQKIKLNRRNILTLLTGLFTIWFYVLIAGAPTPALRAAVMFSILEIGLFLNQKSNTINQLLLAAFMLLLWQPFWIFEIGFQLSFIAVLSILIFYPKIYALFSAKNKFVRWLWSAISLSISAEILIAPLVVYYFHNFPIMFIPANLIASLCMSIVLILSFGVIILSFISPISLFIASIIDFILHYFHVAIYFLHNLNVSSFKALYMSALSLWLWWAFIAFVFAYYILKNKIMLWSSLVALLLLSSLHLIRSIKIHHQQKVIFYSSTKEPIIDIINANTSLASNNAKSDIWVQKNTHIGLGVAHICKDELKPIFIIKNKTFLIIDSLTPTEISIPIDIILIKSLHNNLRLENIIKQCSPSYVVYTAKEGSYRDAKFSSICKNNGVLAYNTSSQGAYVFSSNDY